MAEIDAELDDSDENGESEENEPALLETTEGLVELIGETKLYTPSLSLPPHASLAFPTHGVVHWSGSLEATGTLSGGSTSVQKPIVGKRLATRYTRRGGFVFLLTKIARFHPHDAVSATISSTLLHGSSGNCSRAILEGIAVDIPVVARYLNGHWGRRWS